ncbi:phytanoyl-CoA dioxygenase family protein, partial [bacterium]
MSNDARAHYDEHGYYIAKGVFNPEEVAELERDFDRIVNQLLDTGENLNARWGGKEMDRLGVANTVVLHTHNVQQYSAAWMRAFMHAKFLEAANTFLGPDVVLHHSKLFQKPAENGSPFPMHQDWEYFPTENDTMLAAIVHVSAATDEMGCFRVYPGTHKLGRITGTAVLSDDDMLAKYPLENSTPLEAEPGDVVFFHYFLIHGSKPNRS